MRCDLLPTGVDLITFDFGVNAGPATSARELRLAVGVAVDSVIGPLTALAAEGADKPRLIGALHDAHEAHYRTLPDFADFGAGWLARLKRCTALAINLFASNP